MNEYVQKIYTIIFFIWWKWKGLCHSVLTSANNLWKKYYIGINRDIDIVWYNYCLSIWKIQYALLVWHLPVQQLQWVPIGQDLPRAFRAIKEHLVHFGFPTGLEHRSHSPTCLPRSSCIHFRIWHLHSSARVHIINSNDFIQRFHDIKTNNC